MQGMCLQCDREFEDIQEHLDSSLKGHNGRKPQPAEITSGTIFCKVCRNDIRTPRGKKYEEPPKHECEPATQRNDGRWIAPDGRETDQFHITIDPDPSEFD